MEGEPVTSSPSERVLTGLALVVTVALTGVALWMTRGSGLDRSHVAVIRQPDGIMGTTTTLVAVVPLGREAAAQHALKTGEQALRQIDALMSTYLDGSEVSVLNRAGVGEAVVLSPAVRDVLATSYSVWWASDGAFDPTCRPLLELWRRAGIESRVPSEEELVAARDASSWEDFEVLENGLNKKRDSARIDLGGVAKGFGIDRAFDAMMSAGCVGALVDVGGDVRVGGHDDRGEPWTVAILDPFADRSFTSLEVENRAVCTSGGYRRFVEIDGVRFSHIVDPRDGVPIAASASVTVVADDAATADAWATALSVLGAQGFERLPAGVEALLVRGDQENCTVHATPEMARLLGGLPGPPCTE
jgi:thiamine biosynthesis lipoprotein